MIKTLKTIAIIIAAILLLSTAAVLTIPFVYKNSIVEKVLDKAKQSVNARVHYSKYSLSLLRTFPNFEASFSNVSFIGIDDFEGDTLFAAKSIEAQIDIMSVFRNEAIEIKTIALQNSLIQLIEKDGKKYNWSIEKQDTTKVTAKKTSPPKTASSKAIKMLFQNIEVDNLSFKYLNIPANYSFSAYNISGSIKGEMLAMETLLDIDVSSPSVNYYYNNTGFLSKSNIKLHTQLKANLNDYIFTFTQGETTMNDFPLEIEGGFEMPGDSMFFDILFNVPNIDMDKALALIPNEYQKYLNEVDASGNVTFNGTINGLYYKNIYPSIDIHFDISKGTIQYPDLPDQINIESLKALISKPTGELNMIEAGVSECNISIAENPLSMHAIFKNIVSDPLIDIAIHGDIDLFSLTKVFPLSDTKLEGMVRANANIKGYYSSLNKNDFTSFVSAGEIQLSKFRIQNSSIPQGIKINDAAMVLKNQDIQIKNLQGNIGSSDFNINGHVSNVVSYFANNSMLKGKFTLKSNSLNINQFATNYKANPDSVNNQTIASDSASNDTNPIEIPKNIDFEFIAKANNVLYDKMDIKNFEGKIIVRQQQLILKQLQMNMLKGNLKMNGVLVADGRKNPSSNFTMDISNFDFPTAYQQLSMVKQYIPFAAKSTGSFSSQLTLEAPFNNDFKMLVSEVSAKGNFSTKNLRIFDTGMIEKLNTVINTRKIKNIGVDNFVTYFHIQNGNLSIDPFETKVAQQAVNIKGAYNLAGTVDFTVDATLDKEILSNNIQQIIAYIPGNKTLNKIDVGIKITGNSKKPTVSVDNEKIKQQVINQLKKSSKQDIEDAARKIFEDLFK